MKVNREGPADFSFHGAGQSGGHTQTKSPGIRQVAWILSEGASDKPLTTRAFRMSVSKVPSICNRF